jgi:hypothetical protein
MVMDRGKTNRFSKREYAMRIRNKEVIACPVGALALYLLYRWHRGAAGEELEARRWKDSLLDVLCRTSTVGNRRVCAEVREARESLQKVS